jgi:hypothetical protein
MFVGYFTRKFSNNFVFPLFTTPSGFSVTDGKKGISLIRYNESHLYSVAQGT